MLYELAITPRLPSPTDPDCERAHRTGALANQTNCFTLNKPLSTVVVSSAAARALDRTNKSFFLSLCSQNYEHAYTI